MSIIRTFHNVGHGAFYSEKIGDYIIVYDCGSLYAKNNPESIIETEFQNVKVINSFFISHLDDDHISSIGALRKQCDIKRVILPLLNNKDKLDCMASWKRDKIEGLGNYVINPELMFDSNTEKVFVRKYFEKDNDNNTSANQNQYVVILDSGTIIPIRFQDFNDFWITIPFNMDNPTRSKEFEKKLSEIGITNVEQLNGDQLLDLLVGNNSRLDEIKACYKKIHKNLNDDSMIVYSGPNIGVDLSNFKGSFSKHSDIIKGNFTWNKKPACIYTGDANCKNKRRNRIKLSEIFSSVWDKVGTIQIPHHGSINNFNVENLFFGQNVFFCPISCETGDEKHPAQKVIEQMQGSGNCPICITENPVSKFIETFLYNESV